jgi:hypothetical protein
LCLDRFTAPSQLLLLAIVLRLTTCGNNNHAVLLNPCSGAHLQRCTH